MLNSMDTVSYILGLRYWNIGLLYLAIQYIGVYYVY